MDALPSVRSTLTFLFTDIEQSSPLWDAKPAEMRAAMGMHDRLMVRMVERHSGRVFRKTGDGICAVFDAPIEALHAGIAIQSALPEMPGGIRLNVRMAVHAGLVHEREGDYDGEPLNRLARILSFAQGGQILLSSAAAALAATGHPEDITFRELGTHSLRGLSVEETIFQVLHPSLSADAPAITTARSTGRLPVAINSFIGRAESLAHLVTLLHESRLVTLTGPGGIGKTRLAVEAASRSSSEFEHGCWFVDLQNVVDPDRVLATVAIALGVKESAGQNLEDALRNRLGSRKMLLVVDNCEQVLVAAAQTVHSILDMSPRVQLLATGREVLGLKGERIFRVSPLTIPSDGDPMIARGTEAVRLFVDRALYANPRFRITEENLSSLCSLTQRLDGIPLAIELAAARMRSMSLEQLVERLDDGFAILKSSFRDELPRHQTLMATMEWSFRLLSTKERTLFARLGAFAGSWSVESCEQIAAVGSLRKSEILDLLSSLVDKSLVIAEEWRSQMRYKLLETVRAHARTKLAEAKDEPAVRGRFFDCMVSMAADLDVGIRGQDQVRWRRLFDLEIDNFRSAIDWGISHEDRLGGVAELLCNLAHTWLMNGEFSEARAYFDRLGELLPSDMIDLRSRVRMYSGILRVQAGNLRGLDLMKSALELAQGGSRLVRNECLGWLATTMFELRRFDEAEALFHDHLALISEDPPLPEGYIRLALGALATERGEFDEAVAQYGVMLEEKQRLGDVRGTGLALCYLGHLDAVQQRVGAVELYREAISCLAGVPDYYSMASNLSPASSILLPHSPIAAAQVQGYADQLIGRVGATVDRHIDELASAVKQATRALVSEDSYTEWYEDGKTLELETILSLLGCRKVQAE